MFIVWTTVQTRTDAEALASATVSSSLAACAQVEGPLRSFYRWKGHLEQAEEFRLTFKVAESKLPELEAYVLSHHPYDTPEWIVVRADRVGEKYLSWLEANPTNLPL